MYDHTDTLYMTQSVLSDAWTWTWRVSKVCLWGCFVWISAAGRSQPWEVCLWNFLRSYNCAGISHSKNQTMENIHSSVRVVGHRKETSLMRSSLCFICFSETEMRFNWNEFQDRAQLCLKPWSTRPVRNERARSERSDVLSKGLFYLLGLDSWKTS